MNKKVSILLLSSLLSSLSLDAGMLSGLGQRISTAVAKAAPKQEQLGRWATARAYAGEHPAVATTASLAAVAGLAYGTYLALDHIKTAGSYALAGVKKAWENKGKIALVGAGIAAWYYRSKLKGAWDSAVEKVASCLPGWFKNQGPVVVAAEIEAVRHTPEIVVAGMRGVEAAKEALKKSTKAPAANVEQEPKAPEAHINQGPADEPKQEIHQVSVQHELSAADQARIADLRSERISLVSAKLSPKKATEAQRRIAQIDQEINELTKK